MKNVLLHDCIEYRYINTLSNASRRAVDGV